MPCFFIALRRAGPVKVTPPARLRVFYHALLRGGRRNVNPSHALPIIFDQMNALQKSGLADAAESISICVNGDERDVEVVRALMPKRATIFCNGTAAESELPTLHRLFEMVLEQPQDYYLYHHSKAVSTPGEAPKRWRERMQHYCIFNWQVCVEKLDEGHDACGCHWLTPEQFPGVVKKPFFGGTFWWAAGRYLKKLPRPAPDSWENRWEAESWIGLRNPRVFDFHPGWP